MPEDEKRAPHGRRTLAVDGRRRVISKIKQRKGKRMAEYIALDLETTGVDPRRDKILEIGAARVRDGEIQESYLTFVDNRIKIPEFITELTGITEEMTAGAPSLSEAVAGFLEFCGDMPILGHNILFDYSFIKKAAVNMGKGFERQGIDTCRIARKFMEEPKKKSLESLCGYYHIERARCHRAYDDAVAASQLYDCLKKDFFLVSPAAFEPSALYYQVKKDSPLTKSQKVYLNDLIKYHRIELDVPVDAMTKSEASRMIDFIILNYGRIKR